MIGNESSYRMLFRRRTALVAFAFVLVAGSSPPSISAQDPDETKAVAAVSPQTQRARELIYLFRQFRVFSRDEEWARTVRELVEIGRPAVPELIAELDRTDRNSTMRSLGFTLRAIGDPRAVPALIRAIPKTRDNQGSDCGVSIRDPELNAFMRKHQNHPATDEQQWVARGRPVNEIVTALEKLTGHPVPHPGNGNDNRRERWLAWWEEHKDEYPIDDELRAVAQRRREDDPIEIAGIARFGPLFPTGPDWHLGPVREITLGHEQYANAPAFLDFDSGNVSEIRQGWRRPEPSEQLDYGAIYFQWVNERGVDLRNHGMLDAIDLNAWLIDDDRWETLEGEIRAGGTLELGRETTSYIEPFANGPTDFKRDRVGTFLFTTREGGRGILRVFPEIGENASRRLQYRLFESGKKPAIASLADTKTKTRFRQTVTIPLPLARVNANCLLDLETEKTHRLPPQFEKGLSNLFQFFQEKEAAIWCEERGIDIVAAKLDVVEAFAEGDAKVEKPRFQFMVVCRKIRTVRLLPKSFYQLSIEDVEEILLRDPAEQPPAGWMHFEPKTADDVATYAIQTAEGTIGLIKLEQVPDAADKILIRYRLHPAAKASPGGPAGP